MISSCVLARSPPTKLLWPITIRMRSGTFSLWDLGFLHMKIFSELIIDSCFQNSEYCTCSIFRMISASSICSMLFCIIFLAKFGWTGRPQPSLQVACGRAQALSSIFDKNVWSTNDFQKYGVCEKIVKSKRKDNFDFLLSFIPHCGHLDGHILSASNPSRWRIIKPKPSCLVIGGPVDHPSQNCQNSMLQPNKKRLDSVTGYQTRLGNWCRFHMVQPSIQKPVMTSCQENQVKWCLSQRHPTPENLLRVDHSHRLIFQEMRNTVLVLSFVWFLHLPYLLLLCCIIFLAKFGCWAPPTFSASCLWKSSSLVKHFW